MGDLKTTTSYTMPLKKSTTTCALMPLDPNQGDEALLQEARSQKRKAISPEPRDEELDCEINNLEAIHQQIEKHNGKMLRLSELQRRLIMQQKKSATLRNIQSIMSTSTTIDTFGTRVTIMTISV
jgi:biotin-(acetyl-CoA carboxylase) ligase